ncbi:DMT family transporter [Salinibacterium sp. ZJ70]|uniref:DMT family transporter n=1 Tax=Salinibacterium sp. ZJ70 TaxID=2708084 RepID=UPI00141F085E|nr:DMT family transporter [Salinibacterium sp. ZJ70]
MIVVAGLVSAIVYGVSDFLGGLAARRIPAILVSLVSFVVATVPIAIATPLVGSVWSTEAVVLGVLAGIVGAAAIWGFFAALAIGPMSVISPTVAAVAALVPAVGGILQGERFTALGYLALAALIVAAVLLGVTEEQSGGRLGVRALVLALLSGLGFGGYNVVMELTPPESELAPLLVDLVVGAAMFALIVVGIRMRRGTAFPVRSADRGGLRLAAYSGVLLAIANAVLVWGLHQGQLAIMGVLSALYPLGTVLLALVVLHERLRLVQWVGVALALTASVALVFV